ncbi:hypothetical protein FB45DRAFT_908261, partial [Roridomyces roridus]
MTLLSFLVVEDLQLPPAFTVRSSDSIQRALDLAFERDFSHIPVLDSKSKPLGYIDVPGLKAKWQAGNADPNDRVVDYMNKFQRRASHPYTLITPATPLTELEEFPKEQHLRHWSVPATVFLALTDQKRQFVLGLVTAQDLETFKS